MGRLLGRGGRFKDDDVSPGAMPVGHRGEISFWHRRGRTLRQKRRQGISTHSECFGVRRTPCVGKQLARGIVAASHGSFVDRCKTVDQGLCEEVVHIAQRVTDRRFLLTVLFAGHSTLGGTVGGRTLRRPKGRMGDRPKSKMIVFPVGCVAGLLLSNGGEPPGSPQIQQK
ncbi:hypothetical protein [Mycoplana sp. MJR14]|uniref:hypothetical protein n=1 Tax=Mycoplana sp. MJR14 TaxID=3032583 RepID=UPI0023DB402E|nr:hypothetical protein [Mycoplana sp. MJR14]MDF1635801.1 hypothetical protein [Mycoplana sp. MJR14]